MAGKPKAKTKKKHHQSLALSYYCKQRMKRLSNKLGISMSEYAERAIERYSRKLMNDVYKDKAEKRGVSRSSAWGVEPLPSPHDLSAVRNSSSNRCPHCG